MRLALTLGHVNVDAMLDLVTPEQITEWWAYYILEPFGEPWQHTALLAAVMQNTTASKRSQLAQPEDFLPRFDIDSTETKQSKLKEAEKKLAALYGNNRGNSSQHNSQNPEAGEGSPAGKGQA